MAVTSAHAPLLVGPEAIGVAAGFDYLLGEKHRRGDREVEPAIPGAERTARPSVVLVDDLISSGATLIAAARLLLHAGARSVETPATLCLASADDPRQLREGAISSIRSCHTVAGPAASIEGSAVLAEIRRRDWRQRAP